jgi:hypothetical protein
MTAVLLASGSLSHYVDEITDWLFRLDRHGWFLVWCGVLIFGVLCLRGYGSRKHY